MIKTIIYILLTLCFETSFVDVKVTSMLSATVHQAFRTVSWVRHPIGTEHVTLTVPGVRVGSILSIHTHRICRDEKSMNTGGIDLCTFPFLDT